jgi:hypothetical protein
LLAGKQKAHIFKRTIHDTKPHCKRVAFLLTDAGCITFSHLHLIGEECHHILTPRNFFSTPVITGIVVPLIVKAQL